MKYIKTLEEQGYVFPTDTSLENLRYLLDIGSKPIICIKYNQLNLKKGYYCLKYYKYLSIPLNVIINISKIRMCSKFELEKIYISQLLGNRDIIKHHFSNFANNFFNKSRKGRFKNLYKFISIYAEQKNPISYSLKPFCEISVSRE